MSNENETPTPDYNGQRTVLLPGGKPDTKPIPYKPIPYKTVRSHDDPRLMPLGLHDGARGTPATA